MARHAPMVACLLLLCAAACSSARQAQSPAPAPSSDCLTACERQRPKIDNCTAVCAGWEQFMGFGGDMKPPANVAPGTDDPSLPAARWETQPGSLEGLPMGPRLVEFGGAVWSLGGLEQEGNQYISTSRLCNLSAASCVKETSTFPALSGFAVVERDGALHAFGGYQRSFDGGLARVTRPNRTMYRSAWAPAYLGLWDVEEQMVSGYDRHDAAVLVVGSEVWSIGGLTPTPDGDDDIVASPPVLRSRDLRTWEPVSTDLPLVGRLRGFVVGSEMFVYTGAVLYRSPDGRSWQRVELRPGTDQRTSPLPSWDVIVPYAGRFVFVSTRTRGVAWTADFASWRQAPAFDLHMDDGPAGDAVILVGPQLWSVSNDFDETLPRSRVVRTLDLRFALF